MPGTLINQTLKGINQGVSQQYTEARRETQVKEMVNCLPSISRGALRRNPVEAVGSIAGYITDTRPFVYSYDRGTGDEQYMIVVGNGSYIVYNITTGAVMGSETSVPYLTLPVGSIPAECFSCTTIVDNTFIVNKTKTVTMKTGVGDEDGEINSHKNTGVYWIKRTSQVSTTQETVSGVTGTLQEGYIYSLTSDGIIAEVQATKDTRPTSGDGLEGSLQGSQIAKQLVCSLNGNTWDAPTDTCSGFAGDYELSTVSGSETYYTIFLSPAPGSVNQYIIYYQGALLYNSTTRPTFPFTSGILEIVTQNENPPVNTYIGVADIAGITVADKGYRADGPYVYRQGDLPAEDYWDWSDSFGNEASFGIHGETRSTDLLPDKMPAALGRNGGEEGTGTIVRVTGVTADTIDDYWMEYTGDTWVETREPGLYNTIDETTMPYVFRREAPDDDHATSWFSFGYYGEYAGGYTEEIDPATDSDILGLPANSYYTKDEKQDDSGNIKTPTEYYVLEGYPLSYNIYWGGVIVYSSPEVLSVGVEYPGSDGYVYRVLQASPVPDTHYLVRRYIVNPTPYEIYYDSVRVYSSVSQLEAGIEYLAPDGYYYVVSTTAANEDVQYTYRRYQYQTVGVVGDSLWNKRMIGDYDTAPTPSFVDTTINDIFFHKNRLGVITNDSVVMSELSLYSNFFPNSVRYVPADDMIDLTVATTDVTNLRSAVSTSATLMLFSDDSQFTLSSVDGELTPSSATIEAASRYNYSDYAQAVAIGNQVFFMSQSGNYDQLFSYRVTEGSSIPTRADQLSAHIPSYIPKNISYITGHSVLGTVFMLPNDGTTNVYVYDHLQNNADLIQSAFHKWEFHKKIIGIQVVNNDVYLLNEEYSIGKVSLEVPGDITAVTYRDATQEYESSILFSRFHVRDANGIGTERGRLQLRTLQYSIHDDSHYMTSITNTELTSQVDPLDTWILKDGSWDDGGIWDDTDFWRDGPLYFIREYKDDDKITVMGNAANTAILFSTNTDYPSAGFELNTLNYEALFNQRSRRI